MAYCKLYTANCTLDSGNGLLQTVHWIRVMAYCTLHTVHWIREMDSSKPYTANCTLNSLSE